MQDFTFSEMPPEDELDIKNPIFDLLIKEEDIYPAAEQTKEDLTHIYAKLNSLEDNHPAREALQDEVNSAMKNKLDVEGGVDVIASVNEQLNDKQMINGSILPTGGAATAVAAPLVLGTISTGPLMLLLITLPLLFSMGSVVTSDEMKDSVEAASHAKSLVNDYLDMASHVHTVREDFDDHWARLVGDEGGDLEPDDSLAHTEE